ncbi:DUF4468 domain-containing protein [Pedobacter lithocola]|uniref:DUF4468 domain-containing protein n=1 Tax=Pedobacter lithocola TaxID=1908239 RepID=A0ABV8PA44_9SPHI
MKLFYSLVLFLALSNAAVAQDKQTFSLTSKGFVSSTDTTKNYLVYELPGKTQNELYKKSLIYLSGLYASPKDVLSTIENESITVNAIAPKAIKMKVLYLNPSWDVNYTITFQFKEGKLRISEPNINKISTYTGDVYRTASIYPQSGTNNKEIFNKKGILKQEDGKQNLETYINGFIENYIKGTFAKGDNW